MQYMTQNVRGMLRKLGEVQESHWGGVISKKGRHVYAEAFP